MWFHYYPNTDGLVFVVDSSDIDRIQMAKEELDKLNSHPMLANIPFLIFANKQDLSTAVGKEKIYQKLNLFSYKDRNWHIQPSVGTSGEGVQEGFTWLSKNI